MLKPKVTRKIFDGNSVYLFKDKEFDALSNDYISSHNIGPKAYGLLTLPPNWYPPFFLVEHLSFRNINAQVIKKGFLLAGHKLVSDDKIIIRSNEYDESILNRGENDSYILKLNELDLYKNKITSLTSQNTCKSCWIVQLYITPKLNGHLSNERRVGRDLREWIYELESDDGNSVHSKKSSGKISLRRWRDDTPPDESSLDCEYVYFDKTLEQIAKWAYNFPERLHFEWLWSGKQIYVVQIDAADKDSAGVNPRKLAVCPEKEFNSETLLYFRKAVDDDFTRYSKLANTQIYKNVGYNTVDFYIWDDFEAIGEMILTGLVKNELLHDLSILTSRALVIRTDGADIPKNYRTMLPRSDELRSTEQAIQWIRDVFIEKVKEVDIDKSKFCLISHHFLPAVSSAWCLAEPGKRRVRIESLWGIPEGLYWYAHDVFDVDTLTISPKNFISERQLKINARMRYKDKFIAPNKEGDWVLHKTDTKSDWNCSVTDWNSTRSSSEWVSEIAWNSRRIAMEVGAPVVIMWFIDIPNKISKHQVLPWFHTKWEQNTKDLKKASPTKKNPNAKEYVISNEADWMQLKQEKFNVSKFSRLIVDPSEPELVRNQKFADELANLAIKHNLVVEMSGGILSHAFYMLTKRGANVECRDLYAAEDDEIQFNKLVRDSIPDNILAGGENVEVLRLSGEALIEAVKRKIVEESLEVLDAKTSGEIREELADLMEVVNKLSELLAISESDISDTRIDKNKKRGGFERGLMLTRTKLSSSLSKSSQDIDFIDTGEEFTYKNIVKREDLPKSITKQHTDNRTKNGKQIKQITLTLPMYLDTKDAPPVNFTVISKSGSKVELQYTAESHREGAELKVRIEILNAPEQLDLDISGGLN